MVSVVDLLDTQVFGIGIVVVLVAVMIELLLM